MFTLDDDSVYDYIVYDYMVFTIVLYFTFLSHCELKVFSKVV